jgi:hypothetical protein
MDKDEKDMAEVARKKLEEASLKLYEIRLGADATIQMKDLLDKAREEVDEVLELLRCLASSE